MDQQPTMATYVVNSGDTLYSLSKEYNVKVGKIMAANDMIVPNIKPGDILLIPTEGQIARQQAMPKVVQGTKPAAPLPNVMVSNQQGYSLTRARFQNQQNQPTQAAQMTSAHGSLTQRVAAAQQPVQAAPVMVSQPTATQQQRVVAVQQQFNTIEPAAGAVKTVAPSKQTITYVTHRVKPGQTVYRISKEYGVSVFDIMSANDLIKPQDLKAEQMIRVPLNATTQRAQDIKINQKLAKAKGMVWPAQGKILKSFGHKGNGVTNSGINISLAEGTPVMAAESGTVIYADSALESYGNLVLLRHSDGLVTAYAHNSKLNVAKNQKVQKGQVIALSGATGSVNTPQLHFEVRRNAQPINPLKVLAKN